LLPNRTLSTEQLAEFDRRGVLRLPGFLSVSRARRAREYVQSRLAHLGLWRDGEWRLGDQPRPQWPKTGPKASKTIGNKHPDIEALLDEPALLDAVDALLDGQPFEREIFKRPQVLFSLPNADVWTVPTGWHVDAPRLPGGKRPGVQLFTFLDPVEPGGGGTLIVAGSHRLFNEGRQIPASELRRLLRRHPFFHELYSEVPVEPQERANLLNRTAVVGGVPLELVELTGVPGDAYLTDLRVLHSGAPNAAVRPRIMATHRFLRVDVLEELAKAHGWE
jgi:hypothetical protein